MGFCMFIPFMLWKHHIFVALLSRRHQQNILTLNNSECGLRAFKVAQFYSPICFCFTISQLTPCYKILFNKGSRLFHTYIYLVTQLHRINVKMIFCRALLCLHLAKSLLATPHHRSQPGSTRRGKRYHRCHYHGQQHDHYHQMTGIAFFHPPWKSFKVYFIQIWQSMHTF